MARPKAFAPPYARKIAQPRTGGSLAAIIVLLLFPYVLIARILVYFRRATDSITERQRQQEAWPDALPKQNSIPTERAGKGVKLSRSRKQIPSFFKLPLKIRLVIYNYLFGLSHIHLMTFRYEETGLTRRRNRIHFEYHLDSFPCLHVYGFGSPMYLVYDPGLYLEDINCVCLAPLPRQRYMVRKWRNHGLGVVNLMLTHRLFYHDILNTLFNHRTFQIDNLDSVVLASIEMPLRHFNRITSLFFNGKYIAENTTFTSTIAHFPSTYHEHFVALARSTTATSSDSDLRIPNFTSESPIWLAACTVISSMQSLKKLRMQLSREAFKPVFKVRDNNGVCNGDELFIFGPLEEISKRRELDVFYVEVDWKARDNNAKCTGKGKGKAKGQGRGFQLVRKKRLPRYVEL